MRHSFYDSTAYKLKQAEITHKKWQAGVFNFKRKSLLNKICHNPSCASKFQVKPSNPKLYCSRKCADPFRNLNRQETKILSYCINCRNITKQTRYKYCSNKCQSDYQYLKYIALWKQNIEKGSIGINTKSVSGHIRRYLSE